jgi:hypothetical protein
MAMPRFPAPTMPALLAAWAPELRCRTCHALECFYLYAFDFVVIGFAHPGTVPPNSQAADRHLADSTAAQRALLPS